MDPTPCPFHESRARLCPLHTHTTVDRRPAKHVNTHVHACPRTCGLLFTYSPGTFLFLGSRAGGACAQKHTLLQFPCP